MTPADDFPLVPLSTRIDMFIAHVRAKERVRRGVEKTVEDPKRERVHAECVVEAKAFGLTQTLHRSDPNEWICPDTLTTFLPEVRERLVKEFRPNNVVPITKTQRQ